jgi:hypothetical protein
MPSDIDNVFDCNRHTSQRQIDIRSGGIGERLLRVVRQISVNFGVDPFDPLTKSLNYLTGRNLFQLQEVTSLMKGE